MEARNPYVQGKRTAISHGTTIATITAERYTLRYNKIREAYTALQQQQRGIHYATIATERDTRHCSNCVNGYTTLQQQQRGMNGTAATVERDT